MNPELSSEQYTGPDQEKETKAVAKWKVKGRQISIIELSDFDNFLRHTDEYINGEFSTIRLKLEDPMEVTFFGEKFEDPLTRYELKADNKNNSIDVSCIEGDAEKLSKYLEEYGLEKSDEEIQPH